jgi:hypothetical protein
LWVDEGLASQEGQGTIGILRDSDDCDHPFRRIATSAARVQTTPLDDGGCDASRLVVGQAQ